MEIRKHMNKVMRTQYEAYRRSEAENLWQVYGTYSDKKEKAMQYCKELCGKVDGRKLRIISHNSQFFSVGFEFPHPETGELCFAYITAYQDRFCIVEA